MSNQSIAKIHKISNIRYLYSNFEGYLIIELKDDSILRYKRDVTVFFDYKKDEFY